ncbi:MAG: PH domain-containing protein [Clostridia bacterium]|nr:PH domain-containing protein [Clostridia bacterium]
MNVARKYGQGAELIWSDRKRFLGMPLSFTRYRLVKKPGAWTKLFSDVGFLFSSIDEVNIYRICDIQFHQSLLGKILNTGTITLLSSDESMPTFILKNVKNPLHVRDIFSTLMEEQRKLHNVRLTEFHDHDNY